VKKSRLDKARNKINSPEPPDVKINVSKEHSMMHERKETLIRMQTLREGKESLHKRKAPPVGQYNPKIDVTKSRIDRLTYLWKESKISKKAKSRKNKLKAISNNEPVCDRIIRTLNKKRRWMSPEEYR